jgi:hypothetical protein
LRIVEGYVFYPSTKDKLIEWHLKWNSLYGERLDSIVARISDEEMKMDKTRN